MKESINEIAAKVAAIFAGSFVVALTVYVVFFWTGNAC